MVVVCEVHMMLAVARLMVVSLSCEAKTSVNFAPRKNKRLRNATTRVRKQKAKRKQRKRNPNQRRKRQKQMLQAALKVHSLTLARRPSLLNLWTQRSRF